MQFLKKYWLSIFIMVITLLTINFLLGSVCPSVIFLGIPCPACGLTRATILLINGHFRDSFLMHPLLLLIIVGIILYPLLKRTMRNYKLFIYVYEIITITTFICFYIYRMQHYYSKVEPMIYNKNNLLAKTLAVIEYVKHN
jgi:hypothetical protein